MVLKCRPAFLKCRRFFIHPYCALVISIAEIVIMAITTKIIEIAQNGQDVWINNAFEFCLLSLISICQLIHY